MTSPTREAIVADLIRRLRPVCADWSEQEFTEMVEHLADITWKYQTRLFVETYDRRSTERLLDELKSALAESRAKRGEEK
jgi:hypothetical protein